MRQFSRLIYVLFTAQLTQDLFAKEKLFMDFENFSAKFDVAMNLKDLPDDQQLTDE